jgi:hypothetical protein
MTSSDLEVHAGFFPESAQVTLVIHPTQGGRAEAGFFVRETDGNVRSDASYRDFVLEPMHAPPAQAPPAQAPPAQAPPAQAPLAAANDMEPAPQEIRAPESYGIPYHVPGPRVPSPRLADPSPAAPSPAAPYPATPHPAAQGIRSHTLNIPTFKIDEPLPVRERWLWAIPIALALGLATWMLYHRQKPAESSPVAFRISSTSAGMVQLEWDPNSRAVRDSKRGEIDITEDGKTSQVPFSSDQLYAGKMTYVPRSSDVGFQLTVYPEHGTPVHETTRMIAPASSAPAQPPQLLPASDDDEAQRKIRQLTEDLRRERARTGELLNLNRILENRLGIQPEAPRAPQP